MYIHILNFLHNRGKLRLAGVEATLKFIEDVMYFKHIMTENMHVPLSYNWVTLGKWGNRIIFAFF